MDRRSFIATSTGMVSAIIASTMTDELYAFSQGETVNAAVIGVGRQGRVILGELAKFPMVKVTSVCDISSRRLKSARRRAKGAKTYEDYRQLLDQEKDLTVVFVCTPTHRHAEIAVDCLSAGKHVYCEAPLAGTIEDAKRIAAAEKKSSLVFHVGLQFRSNPIYRLARQFMLSGAIRDCVSLRSQYRAKTSWRTPTSDPSREKEANWRLYEESSTGLPGEIGTHQFDVMSWFLNKLPVSVSGYGTNLHHRDGREIPDTVHCSMKWDSGLRLGYEATVASSYGGRFEEFVGTMGAIKLIGDFGWLFKEADAPTQGWEVYAVRQSFHKEQGITLIADATKLAKQGKLKEGVGLPHPPIHYGVSAFLTSVTTKKQSACSAALGLRSAVLGIKAHQAVMEEKEIVFEDDWFKVG